MKNSVPYVMLTIGLYWIRPYTYLPLDSKTERWLKKELQMTPPKNQNANEYLEFTKSVKSMLSKQGKASTFPELSHAAYAAAQSGEAGAEPPADRPDEDAPYTVSDIVSEGAFAQDSQLEEMLESWRKKKNIILQGPPGTGKTWLAKRLAFALTGRRPNARVRALQFHPNISYEDFVRGWRPSASGDNGGRLTLVDGPFLRAIRDAAGDPTHKYVIVIEEINRGNPANIFGEMLTLLEADKRRPEESLSLSYMHEGESPIFIPDNLYVIGTMNVADRSIAMVDMALRRRFGFYDMEPVFDEKWRRWGHEECGIDLKTLDMIKERLVKLNETIENDALLGPHFRIGHSYVTPGNKEMIGDSKKWFYKIVENEIGPLLDEYWVEEPKRAKDEKNNLIKSSN